MVTEGHHFKETLAALALDEDQEKDTRRNAAEIVSAIIGAYGDAGDGIDPSRAPAVPVTGLVYGRIQSGKTRAMIASTAMAFDNKFRIAIVMTSNINDLVAQTHLDFSSGLPGPMIFTKDNDLDKEIENAKVHLELGNGCLLLVCSKGTKSLENVSRFLHGIGAGEYPAIIFDDEGDQASLDTNTRRRSRSPAVSVAPSAVNSSIQNKLRGALSRHVYVSVTGTPQAILLQSAESTHRPSFIVMLPPGDAYTGGSYFFDAEEPEDNPHLITLVERNEKQQLLTAGAPMPAGLRASILFFLVSAAAAIKNLDLGERGYSYLCHPSLKNDEQEVAEGRINDFLTEVVKALHGAGGDDILRDLKGAHDQLASTLGTQTPDFDENKRTILDHLPRRKLLVINARVKRTGIAYGKGLNFLIGGNTLGRGIAIRDLLVTYYVRDSKISQIDTMHQHARIYGYRKKTLGYTRLFIPCHLYYRFRDIHHSDEDLRTFIDEHKADVPASFPVEYTYDLRTTRPGVLDVRKTDTLRPGMHIFPNYIVLPQNPRAYQKVLALLRGHFRSATDSESDIERLAKDGMTITSKHAIALMAPIRTRSQNTWRDGTIAAVTEKVAGKFGNKVHLRFRTADRRVRAEGFISTGTLSGDELAAARAAALPTLWIMAATTTEKSEAGAGQRFMYPTLVIPERFSKLYMFNRGQ